MPHHVVVRRAEPADAPVLARHRVEMFRAMGRLPDDAAYEALHAASIAWFRAAVPRGEYVAWLAAPAATPDEVVAGAGVQLRAAIPGVTPDGRVVVGRQGLVLNVYTEPAWRRRGVARRLMEEVLAWARRGAVSSLVLHASSEGRALYEALGFVPTNEMRYAGPLGGDGAATA